MGRTYTARIQALTKEGDLVIGAIDFYLPGKMIMAYCVIFRDPSYTTDPSGSLTWDRKRILFSWGRLYQRRLDKVYTFMEQPSNNTLT